MSESGTRQGDPVGRQTLRHEGGKHEGEQRTSPYPMSRLAPAHDLVDVAKQIADADAMVGAVASARLELIARQIRALQDEARTILADTARDLDLHRARCAFAKRPGQVYHVYQREGGEAWISMISPDEWRETPPGYAGSYRLELDQSWTRVDGEHAPAEPRDPRALVQRLLGDGD